MVDLTKLQSPYLETVIPNSCSQLPRRDYIIRYAFVYFFYFVLFLFAVVVVVVVVIVVLSDDT